MVTPIDIVRAKKILYGKTIFLTGHTGFMGSWLSIWLQSIGCNVYGYALQNDEPNSVFNLTELDKRIAGNTISDIGDMDKLWATIQAVNPDIVFHLAAQPLVLTAYAQPLGTYSTNLMGTVNLLECIRRLSKDIVGIFVTTDKCYADQNWYWGYRENDSLGGDDPYSSSKACCEIAVASYRRSFFEKEPSFCKRISTVRVGNIVGGGDWAENRIVPDCIRALASGQDIVIRNPHAVRPWQHVLDPVWGYIQLAAHMCAYPQIKGDAYNYGPGPDNCIPVEQIVSRITALWGSGNWRTEQLANPPKETHYLSLDSSKVRNVFGWSPQWEIQTVLENTVEWYRNYMQADVYSLCLKQIAAYTSKLGKNNEMS